MRPTIDQERGALGDPLVDVVGYPVPVLGSDERTHIYSRLVPWSYYQFARLLTQRVQEHSGSVPDSHCDTASQAALAGVAKGGTEECWDRGDEIGVGHDHDMVLGATQGLHALPMAGGL